MKKHSDFINFYFIKIFREIEDKLDAEIATETEEIQKEEIKINLIREKCLIAVEECDAQYRQFHDNVESLAKIYQDALEKVFITNIE